MKKLILFAAALMLAAACNPGTDTLPEPGPNPNPTPLPEPDPTPVEKADPIELTTRGAEKVSADNAFAFEFFRQTLATVPEADRPNTFVSPLSLTMALGMLYNGTSPEAAAEMAAALGVADFSPEQINEHYHTLYNALLEADPLTTLTIANSIWARQGFDVKPAFYNLNSDFYNAEVQTRDFDDPATVDVINEWCADNTNGKIPEILSDIPPLTMMYLINAVYFKGAWKYTFDEADTRDEDFTLADGSKKKVKMMSQKTDLPSYADGTMQCVDLPYGNGAFSMTVMMPADPATPLDELIASLDAGTYNNAIDGLRERGIELKLPRWKQECEFPLKEAVLNLGMHRIFGGGSLSGINDDPRLAVSGIKQKSFIEVTEEGTEAAAVTVVEIGITGVDPNRVPPHFYADRPFLYLIRERSTGAILFMGRMDEPKS